MSFVIGKGSRGMIFFLSTAATTRLNKLRSLLADDSTCLLDVAILCLVTVSKMLSPSSYFVCFVAVDKWLFVEFRQETDFAYLILPEALEHARLDLLLFIVLFAPLVVLSSISISVKNSEPSGPSFTSE